MKYLHEKEIRIKYDVKCQGKEEMLSSNLLLLFMTLGKYFHCPFIRDYNNVSLFFCEIKSEQYIYS